MIRKAINFSCESIEEFRKLGISVSNSNILTVGESTNSNSINDTDNSAKKDEGQYKVLRTCIQFRGLDNTNIITGTLFKDDTFDLIGNDYIYISDKLFRKVLIKTSWFSAIENKIGWLPVEYTNAPQTAEVKKVLHGHYEVISDELIVKNCNTLEPIGYLEKGDSIDLDSSSSNEYITLDKCVLKKVIIMDSENESLINQKVWMPLFQITNSNINSENDEIFKITKDSLPLFIDSKLEDSLTTKKEDQFILVEEPMKIKAGRIYKKVEIVSSNEISLVGETGWLEIAHTGALISNVNPVEEVAKRREEPKNYTDIILERTIVGYKPDCSSVSFENITCLEAGSFIRALDKKDSNNRIIVEVVETGNDGIDNIVEYAVNPFLIGMI